MRIAVCFSSQLRGAIQAHKNIINYFEGIYDNCVFFAHTWDINTRKPYVKTGEVFTPERIVVNEYDFIKFNNIYNLKKFCIESFDIIKEEHHKNGFYFDPIYYSWYKSLEMMESYKQIANETFDLVIKLRPDMLFNPKRRFLNELLLGYLYNSNDTFFVENLITDWKSSERMNDVYWVSNPSSMNIAKEFYLEQRHNGDNYTLLKHLKKYGINLANLGEGYGYCCLKLECVQYDTLEQYDKCIDCENFYFGT